MDRDEYDNLINIYLDRHAPEIRMFSEYTQQGVKEELAKTFGFHWFKTSYLVKKLFKLIGEALIWKN